jgi:hypothetical protein
MLVTVVTVVYFSRFSFFSRSYEIIITITTALLYDRNIPLVDIRSRMTILNHSQSPGRVRRAEGAGRGRGAEVAESGGVAIIIRIMHALNSASGGRCIHSKPVIPI